MIPLKRPSAPTALNEDLVEKLTQKYKQTKESVWNKDFIKNPLRDSSNHKCAYCETNISEESKYMEVEHYRCKRDFPELVVIWNNLLPSCKRCNGQKGEYNVDADGNIINPYTSIPANHIYMKDYRIKWKDEVGKNTITALYLNDTDRLVVKRAKIGTCILNSVDKIRDLADSYIKGDKDFKSMARIKRGLEELLLQAQPNSEFSTVAATVLMGDEDYLWMTQWLQTEGEWDLLEDLHNNAKKNAL